MNQLIINKQLRDKIRDLKSSLKEVTLLVLEISKRISALESVTVDLVTRLDALESKEEPGAPSKPEVVDSTGTLKMFCSWFYIYPTLLYSSNEANVIKDLSRGTRNGLISHYPNQFSLAPGWTDTENRHLDAVYHISTGSIIDFVKGSTDRGIFWDKLQWLVYPPEQN